MKNWKKIFIFISMAAFVISITACSDTSDSRSAGSNNETQTDNTMEEESNSETADEGTEESIEPTGGQDSDTLIAYFSYTGNTEKVAQQIADYTGGTLVEIERATPYEDAAEEGENEINNNIHPEITVNLDSIDNFDTIFIGYPIWFDEAPMVIDTFLESFDFSGKTIVPFCTSASDSIDNSLHIFSELAPDAEIAEGLTANDEADIVPWLNELGY